MIKTRSGKKLGMEVVGAPEAGCASVKDWTMWTQLLLSAAALISFVGAASLPPYIKQCKNDNKLNACILKGSSAAIKGLIKGDPKFGIPVLDPILIEKIEHTSSASRSVSLNFTLSKVKVHGLTNAEIVKPEFDVSKRLIKFSSKVPQLKIDSDYNLNGKFLVLPVVGNGKLLLTIDDLYFTFMVNYNIVEKKGAEYISLVLPPKLTYTTTKVGLDFTNLFNGDKNLGENFNKLVNENWKEWDAHVGPGIADALGQVIGTILKKVTDAIPLKEILS